MRITIADIAKEAGVSKATVSRVLNDKADGVGEETRQRVKAVMERMEFEPCGVARGLATGRSRSIGLVIPDIADPFAPLLIRGIEDALRGGDYGLFLCDSAGDIEREKEQARMLLEKRVDGIILNSVLSDCDCQLDLLDRRSVPYVLLDRMIELRPGAAGVCADNRAGARMAIRHLLGGGARRLVFLNGPAGLSVSKEREAGVEEALREGPAGSALVARGNGDYSVASGERFAEGLDEGFDALFAANDLMAIGAARALKRRGIDVPGRVEIVGFDDIETARLVEPPLTTVAQPAFEMGREAALLLLRLVAGERPRRRKLVLEPKLVVRGTTRPR